MNCLSQIKIKEILYVLLDKYAAHEMVFLSQEPNHGASALATSQIQKTI